VTFPPLPQPIKAGTRFSDPRGMQGWVDLVMWFRTKIYSNYDVCDTGMYMLLRVDVSDQASRTRPMRSTTRIHTPRLHPPRLHSLSGTRSQCMIILKFHSVICHRCLLGPFHGAIAVPAVTRCHRRRRGHWCAGGVQCDSSDTWWMVMQRAVARCGEWAQHFSNASCLQVADSGTASRYRKSWKS